MVVRDNNGKNDPRMDRTRKLIEDAFLAVMDDKGFEDLSVNDVAERAGINRVTFYSHFADKYALLEHSVRKMFGDELALKGLSARALDAESIRELFLTMCTYVEAIHEHCKPPHDHLDWIIEAQISQVSAGLLSQWTERSGKSHGSQTTRLTAVAASSAMSGLVHQWLHSKKRISSTAFVRESLPIVLGVLGVQQHG